MDKSALTPTDNVVINIYGDLKKQEEDTFKDLQDRDLLWKEFRGSSYYKLVEEYVDNLVDKLDGFEGEAFESGATNEEIVMRRAVVRLTKTNLKSLLAKADGTK